MKKSNTKTNLAFQMAYELLILLIPLITAPYISRVVGAEGLGRYSYARSVAHYFVLFSLLGIKNYGNRAVAKVRDNREVLNQTFANLFASHALISMVCLAVYALYCMVVKTDPLLAVIEGMYVLSAFFDISWFYFGIEKFKITVTRSTIIRFLKVALMFVLVKEQGDLWKYCALMAGGTLLSQLALWIPLKKLVTPVPVDRKEMLKHIKPMLVLFIPVIAVSLYKHMDKIMIGAMSSKTQLGYYENAEKVVNLPLTVITSFGTVMMPKMSNLVAKKDEKETGRYMTVSMQYIMCLAFALAFGLASIGVGFAPIFFGEEFAVSGYLIMGLATTIPFIAFANVIRTQHLIPREKDREYIASVVAGGITNMIINALLIPRYGAQGAVVGTIAAETLVFLVQVWSVRKELPILRYIKNCAVFVPIGAVMFWIVQHAGDLVQNGTLRIVFQVAVGGVCYLLCSSVYFYFKKDSIFMEMIKKIKR